MTRRILNNLFCLLVATFLISGWGWKVGAHIRLAYDISHLTQTGFDQVVAKIPLATLGHFEERLTQKMEFEFASQPLSRQASVEKAQALGAKCDDVSPLEVKCEYKQYVVRSNHQTVDIFGKEYLEGRYKNEFEFTFALVLDSNNDKLVRARKLAFSGREYQNF